MSKRRAVGDIVIKRENAGFVGERLKIRIVDIDPDPRYTPDDPCLLDCGDSGCREWANCEVLDEHDSAVGYVYHVSECQMEDA